jgi:hypothetical protein
MRSESQWRYRAYRKGLRLVKYKESSSASTRYGPYALVDQSTNQVAVARLDAEGVERQLFEGSDGAAEAAS